MGEDVVMISELFALGADPGEDHDEDNDTLEWYEVT